MDRHEPFLLLRERDDELGAIRELFHEARSGTGRALVVEGPAGIGKTRLLAEALDAGSGAGLEVLQARANELERDFPFGVARQLFVPALRRRSDAERAEVLKGAAALAGPLLGFDEGGEAPRPSSNPLSTALHGLFWLTAALADASPTLVVVDDAHWADLASLRLLAHLGARLEDLPLGLVVSLRPGESAPEANAALLGLAAEGRTIRPRPFTASAVAALVGEVFETEGDADFVEACASASGGNPFLLRQLLEELRREGRRPDLGSAGRVRRLGPEGVRRSLARRLGHLSPNAAAVLSGLAVLGEGAELRHVAGLMGLGLEEAGEAADLLSGVELLARERPLAFVHPIVRTAVLEELAPAERRRLHGLAAGVLAAEGASSDAVAAQLLGAEPAERTEVVDLLVAAAHESLARGAPETAVDYLRRALVEPPAPQRRPALMLELGEAEALAADPAAEGHLRAAYEGLEDPNERARAALGLGWSLTVTDRVQAGVEVMREALEDSSEALDRESRFALEGNLITSARFAIATKSVVVDRVGRLGDGAEIIGETPAERGLLAQLAVEQTRSGESASRATELAERSLGVLEYESPQGLFQALHAARALILSGRQSRALAFLERATDESRRRGDSVIFAAAQAMKSEAHHFMGNVAPAEDFARAALEVLETTHLDWYARACFVEALLESGKTAEAQSVTADFRMPEGRSPETYAENMGVYTHALVDLAQRNLDAAARDLLAHGQWQVDIGEPSPASRPWRSRAALAIHALGDGDQAGRLVEEELELARRFGAPRPIGIALRARGVLASGKSGLEDLREAAQILEEDGAKLEEARALTDLGAALRRGGQRSAAQEQLRRGLDLAVRCGGEVLAEQTRAELRASGARPRREVLSGRDALTPSELRIAEQAAEGKMNRQIAGDLFLSLKTVEGHLGQAFRKLRVGSRADLEEALARAGEGAGVAEGANPEAHA